MKLSTKGRYGLRAIIDIAVHCEREPVAISGISERQNISISYLEQILPKLRKAGFIQSIRGTKGGYVLAKKDEEISVGDILRVLEGDLIPVNCAELTGEEKTCAGRDQCVTRYVWKKINDSIQKTVDSIYLKELVEESKKIQEGKSR